MNQQDTHYSEFIINHYPQKLALIYKHFVEAEVDNRPNDAIYYLHLFAENLVKHVILFLACDELDNGASHIEMKSRFKRHFCDRPTFGRSIDFLSDFFETNRETEMSRIAQRGLNSTSRHDLKAFTDEYKAGDHSAIRDERNSRELLKKFAPIIQGIAEKNQLFRTYTLSAIRSNGLPVSLHGVNVPRWETQFSDSKLQILAGEDSGISAWPFFLLEEDQGVCDVRSLEQLNSNVEPEVVYFGTTTSSATRISISNPLGERDNDIISGLQGCLGVLVRPPLRIKTDDFSDIKVASFTGRQWLLKRLDNFVASPLDEDRLLIVYGMPGAGKTSVIAEHRRQRDSKKLPSDDLYNLRSYFFIVRSSSTRKNVNRCFENLLNDLQKQVAVESRQGPRGAATSDLSFVDKFRDFRSTLERAEPTVRPYKTTLLIDGVDELNSSDIGPFMEQLCDILRLGGYRAVLTSRKIKELESLAIGFDSILIDSSPENMEDLRFYACSEFPEWGDEDIELLVEKTGGCIYYLTSLIRGIKRHEIEREELGTIPTDFEVYLSQLLGDRMTNRFQSENLSWEKLGKTILALMLVQRQPLSVEQLSRFSGKPEADVRKAVKLMEELFRLVEFERLREKYDNVAKLPEEFRPESYLQSLRSQLANLDLDYSDVRKLKLHAYVAEYFERNFGREITNAHRRLVDFYWQALSEGRHKDIDQYFFTEIPFHIVEACPSEIEMFISETQFYQLVIGWILTPCVEYSIENPVDSYWGKCWSSGERFDSSISTWLHCYFDCIARTASNLKQLVLQISKLYPIFRTLSTPERMMIGYGINLSFHAFHWIDLPPMTVSAEELDKETPYCSSIELSLALRFPKFATSISALNFGVLDSIVSKISLRDLGIWQPLSGTECEAIADLPSWHDDNMSTIHYGILQEIALRDQDLAAENIYHRWETNWRLQREYWAKRREEEISDAHFAFDEHYWEKNKLRELGLDDLVTSFESEEWRTEVFTRLMESRSDFLEKFKRLGDSLESVRQSQLSNSTIGEISERDIWTLQDRLLIWIIEIGPTDERANVLADILPVLRTDEMFFRTVSWDLLEELDNRTEIRDSLRIRAFSAGMLHWWIPYLDLQKYLYANWPDDVLDAFLANIYPKLVLESTIAWDFLRSKDPKFDRFKESLYNSIQVVDARDISYRGFGRVIDVDDDDKFFLARLCKPIAEFEDEVFERLSPEVGQRLMKVWYDDSKLLLSGSLREIISEVIEKEMAEGANTRALLESLLKRILN